MTTVQELLARERALMGRIARSNAALTALREKLRRKLQRKETRKQRSNREERA